MRILLLSILLLMFSSVFAQKDIDVLFLNSGERIECTIQKIENDTIHITRFSGKTTIERAYPMDQVAVHLVNNIYSTPGEEMIKAAGHFYTGTSFVVIGGVVTVVALNDDKGDKKELAYAGAGFSLLGAIFMYSGYAKLKKAGRKFNKLQLQNDRLIYKL
ncbi:MAG: hypothetical protein ACLFPE_05985 [Bacteroidales bacterium]